MKTSAVDELVRQSCDAAVSSARVVSTLGWVSLKNPGLKHRPNFLSSFNFATEHDEIDYISQFTREADLDIVRKFYRGTNGMRLFADKFVVPGVLFQRDNFSELDFYCVAIDISVKGGFALPTHSPENGFLIGVSQIALDRKWVRQYDILTKSGEIVGGYFDNSPRVADHFKSIDNWLSDRIYSAAKSFVSEISKM